MGVLAPALTTLRDEGYEVLSLSGGEPMLYPDLKELTAHAKALGYRVVAITNGFRLSARFAQLLEGFDGLAVSFDGMQEVHNRVRGNSQAFEVAVAALGFLADIGKPSAAAYTVSRESLADIPDFVEMAAGLGVRAVQLRPLVMAGRATRDYADPALSLADLNRVWLIGQALAACYCGQPAVHTDLAHAQVIAADQDAWSAALDEEADALSGVVNPLVITSEGVLRPYTFDFPTAYDLGRIEDVSAGQMGRIRDTIPRLRDLLRAVLEEVARRDEFIDWFAFCRDFSRKVTA